MHRTATAIALAIFLAAASAFAASLPYLYQRLQTPAYKTAFAALFQGQANLAPWVQQYLATGNGVEAPGQPVGGGQYELYATCEPHDCAGNFLYTLFVPGGRQAWALFTADGASVRFFGNPDPQQQALLTAAAKQQ